ncbi:uncharacterized protein LOC110451876 [Mizuhopecten yessoensis]|uniref:uncharacterized protein LOC110451876 n=1 Tax=Mizuhopecten yessoensis TaxID=6573 RepID=UPI000B45EC0D|nr:uncharacterized protein LOC110451876 [Mizuhopecten yessoensis]
MTGLTSERNLLSAWRSSSSLAANISVFVVAAIVLGVSGDVSSSAFTRGDAVSFSYISYFILVVGGSCCITFYLLVPEKTQTCEDAKTQFNGCCYRSKVVHPYGSTKASNLRRGSNMATLTVDTGKMSERKRSLSGGSSQLMSRRQSDGQTRSSQTLQPINNEETRTKSPRNFSKTGHLVINVQKMTDGNKMATGSKVQGPDNNKVTVQSKGQVNTVKAATSGLTNNEKLKAPTTPEKDKLVATNTEKSQTQTPNLDLKKTANLVVNTKRVGGNFKAKQMLRVGSNKTGSRSPSPGVSGRKSRDVSTSQKISPWCCLCPKVKDKSMSSGQASVKIRTGKSTKQSKNSAKNPEKSKSCYCCCRRQKDNDRSHDRVQRSNKKRDCCPWFKGMCKKPKFFKSVVIHACSKLAFLIAQVYMPLYLTESLAMGKISTAIIPLVVYISGFIATLVTRKINAKYGRKRTFAIGEGCVLGASVWLFFIPVETSSQVYATACLLGVGLSTLQVRSVSMMTDLTGSPVDSGAAVFGVNEKIIQAVAVLLLQVLSPCRLDAHSDDCKLFYRSIMLSMPGGSTFISFLVLALAKVVGIDDEEQGLEVSDGNAIEISSSIAV